MECKHHRCQGK